ncbi:MAG: AAA family ATPase [Clostridiales bacterium]|nr:AAA family ATPase [Clostridiales bacterium]
MIFLQSFHMLSKVEDENFFNVKSSTFKAKTHSTYYTTYYPFMLFRERDLPDFNFDDITIFYGDNGSGKSTILNVMAETLGLQRGTAYNRSDFFDDYVELCHFELAEPFPAASKIITSDDVFDKVLDIRRINEGIDSKKANVIEEFISERSNPEPNLLKGLDDYERWKSVCDARKKTTTQSQYLRSRVMRNLQERSNGESALSFFVDSITDGALYLLDEPENSLSPSNQIQLKYFIEDCVRNHQCQFVISTHSPFLLSLQRAKIYDIDSVPVCLRRWTELEGVRAYYDFFAEYKDIFES